MERITATNTTDFQAVAYYCIDSEIIIDRNITVAAGSVLDFCGGYFLKAPTLAESPKVSLNGSQVIGAPYCIFRDVKISGFAQAEVYAEWFNYKDGITDNTLGEESFINAAIESADGCPVVLNARTYNLKNPIKFLPINASQTLISPGVLKILADDKAAIELENVSNVTLKVNTITGSGTGDTRCTKGIGIAFTGSVSYSDIDVFYMYNLKIGIDISPKATIPSGGTKKQVYVQYCNIKFQYIYASTCINIDLFAKNNKDDYTNCWIMFNQFYGGRLTGNNGILFGVPTEQFFAGNSSAGDSTTNETFVPSCHISGLLFECIGFEDLDTTPLSLAYVSQSKIQNIRMMESLPGIGTDKDGELNGKLIYDKTYMPWISFNNVSDIEISVKGYVRTNHLNIVGHERKPSDNVQESTREVKNTEIKELVLPNTVQNVVVKGNVLDSGYFLTHFDTVLFRTFYDNSGKPNPKMFVTSSVQPYNAAKVVTSDDFTYGTITLAELMPTIINPTVTYHEDKKAIPKPKIVKKIVNVKFDLLSDMVYIILKKSGIWTIDLEGIWRLQQIIPSFYVKMTDGASLKFIRPETSASVKLVKDLDDISQSSNSISFDRGGLYKLEWDERIISDDNHISILRILRVAE